MPSKIVQCSHSELKKLRVTVTPYFVEELQQLTACMEGEDFLHIVQPSMQELTIPVPELKQLAQALSHLEPNKEILLIYQEHSRLCVFQYPATDGYVETFRVTNQLQFQSPALAV
jgi:hypothetical protein